MRYVLAVNQPIYGTQAGFFAYQFAHELLQQGHQISQIFFFQQGVTQGNAFVYPTPNEFNLQQHWQQLSLQYQVPLHLCITASQRRGIVDQNSARENEQHNLADHFILAGLGEFSRAVLEADRLISL